MAIKFENLDRQVQILKQRNLIIEDEEKAKQLLLRSNYYDVVNGYSKFFQLINDRFEDGTTFEELYKVYMLDKDMKALFLRKIVKIEAALRANIAYVFSENHRGGYDFLKTTSFSNKDVLNLPSLIARLSATINNHKTRKHHAISHYYKNYKTVPFWVLVNFLDFGALRIFYTHMLQSERDIVADNINKSFEIEYGYRINLSPREIDSFLNNIIEVRNICAHDNRLISHLCQKNIVYFPDIHTQCGIKDIEPKQSLYHVYLIMIVFLPKEQFGNLTKALKKRMKNLNSSLKKTMSPYDANSIIKHFGFPKNWYS